MVELPDETALNVKTKEIEIIPDESLDILKKVAMDSSPTAHLPIATVLLSSSV